MYGRDNTPSLDIGNALSFALKLRNKNKGTNHTQTPKNVATSANPGGGATDVPVPVPTRAARPCPYRPVCCAACHARERCEK